MTNIETPEGWERREGFLFRTHGQKFATIWQDEDRDWQATVATNRYCALEETVEATLPDAVAWANEQLGVPQLVEVMEREFDDGLLLWSDQTKRCARVEPFTGDWQHGIAGGWLFGGTTYKYKPEAIQAARAYVRGDA